MLVSLPTYDLLLTADQQVHASGSAGWLAFCCFIHLLLLYDFGHLREALDPVCSEPPLLLILKLQLHKKQNHRQKVFNWGDLRLFTGVVVVVTF